MKKTPSSPAPSPPLLHTSVQSSTTPPGTTPLGARCREPTALKQRGLHNGIEARRLMFTCKRRPKRTDAKEEGGNGHPSTILDGSQQRASMISLPGAASILPPPDPAPADARATDKRPPDHQDQITQFVGHGHQHQIRRRSQPYCKRRDPHRKEEEHWDATDLAREICRFSPGTAPTTSIKPRPKPKPTTSMYRDAGVSPLPSSTGYSGERGSGLTRSSMGDTQGRRRTRREGGR